MYSCMLPFRATVIGKNAAKIAQDAINVENSI